jgi:UDP-N-acetyl-D-mannosaminuronate dehydrogenase
MQWNRQRRPAGRRCSTNRFSRNWGANKTVGLHMKKGVIVMFESIVYPGPTEEVCIPISPERINPCDKGHREFVGMGAAAR